MTILLTAKIYGVQERPVKSGTIMRSFITDPFIRTVNRLKLPTVRVIAIAQKEYGHLPLQWNSQGIPMHLTLARRDKGWGKTQEFQDYRSIITGKSPLPTAGSNPPALPYETRIYLETRGISPSKSIFIVLEHAVPVVGEFGLWGATAVLGPATPVFKNVSVVNSGIRFTYHPGESWKCFISDGEFQTAANIDYDLSLVPHIKYLSGEKDVSKLQVMNVLRNIADPEIQFELRKDREYKISQSNGEKLKCDDFRGMSPYPRCPFMIETVGKCSKLTELRVQTRALQEVAISAKLPSTK